MKKIRIGSGAGYAGDRIEPAIDLIEQGNIIGINTEGSAIIDDFIKAYFSLAPWDDWHDPEYLDKLLISPDKKPENLIYKNK